MFTSSNLTPSTENNDSVAPNKVPLGSTPNNIENLNINRELNTYKVRLALELNNFKKQLETQSRIEMKCAKQNFKSEFDHELQHQTLTKNETINALRQQIDQLGVQLHQQNHKHSHPRCDSTSSHHLFIITAKIFHYQMIAWLKSWMF